MTRRELETIGEKLGINCKGTGKPGPCKGGGEPPPFRVQLTSRVTKTGVHYFNGPGGEYGVHKSMPGVLSMGGGGKGSRERIVTKGDKGTRSEEDFNKRLKHAKRLASGKK